MRYRSRSRNYESSERYKGRKSTEKYESSRRHKSKDGHTHYSSENKKNESDKYKKTNDRSRYDSHRDSESEDKLGKKSESNHDRDYKISKGSKYEREEGVRDKRSRKGDDYTHSYRRSASSNASYDSGKHKRNDEKSDPKKSYYKDTKRNKFSRSVSSEHKSDEKIKHETKDKKDKRIKKKSKKNEKEKIDKKKKKKQKHSVDEEKTLDEKKTTEIKPNVNKTIKKEPVEESDEGNKDKIKLEPFKVKETSTIKSQINVLNSSNIFTKDEWQKEASGDEAVKKKDSSKSKHISKESSSNDTVKKKDLLKSKQQTKENVEETTAKPIKDEKVIKKIKRSDAETEDSNKKKRHKDVKSKVPEKIAKISKEKEVENNETSSKSKSSRHERSHSHSKALVEKSRSSDHKEKKSRDHKVSSKNSDERKKTDEYLSEDERLELPRTPTDAQFAGLFTRLPEESVSDTDIEDILPPMLLDDRMNALLDNDPNGAQEAWDSEDDVLLNKRENIIAPKHRGVLETLAVPWKLLIEEASLTNKNALTNETMRKYEVPNMLANVGVSCKLAGEVLWKSINEKYSNVFLSPVALIHQSLLSQKVRRNTIFREREQFAGALSARKDFFVRRIVFEPSV